MMPGPLPLGPDKLGLAWPLLEERAHADLLVLGGEKVHEDLALEREAVPKVHLESAVDRHLGGPQSNRRPARELRSHLDRRLVRLIGWNHTIGKPKLKRLDA